MSSIATTITTTISTLYSQIAASPVASAITNLKAQDTMIGALASVIFSRAALVFSLALSAWKLAESCKNQEWDSIKQEGVFKALFSNIGRSLKIAGSGLGAVACAVGAVYVATRKTF